MLSRTSVTFTVTEEGKGCEGTWLLLQCISVCSLGVWHKGQDV
jgi:hypothetical protein